jgi:hypothetical protein
MTIAMCTACGEQFDRDEPWKKICLDCWIANKKREEKSAKKQQRRNTSDFGSQRQHQTPPVQPATLSIDPVILRRLIQLCHPDKHGNSTVATEITCWLLKLRA